MQNALHDYLDQLVLRYKSKVLQIRKLYNLLYLLRQSFIARVGLFTLFVFLFVIANRFHRFLSLQTYFPVLESASRESDEFEGTASQMFCVFKVVLQCLQAEDTLQTAHRRKAVRLRSMP